MKMKNAALLAAVGLCIVLPLFADVTGTIAGRITDPSGATVTNVQVTLRNDNTGLLRTTTTNSIGDYEFLAVPVGDNYSLEVQAPGFRRSTRSSIELQVNQHFRADFTLVVGNVTESVTVQAQPVQVESESTQLGDVIDERKMTTLPLNGRSYIDLMGLQAGVVPVTSVTSRPDRPVSGNLSSGAFSVNGQRETANAFLVNGSDVEENKNNGAAVIPVLDSIQEFRLLTSTFDAEYGRFSGAVVNVVTKSGTNQIHGTLFEFVRNDIFDARNFFDQNNTDPATGKQIPNSAKGIFKRNQYGYAVGLPILKDHLFLFTDYQGTRERRGLSSGLTSVPSLAERSGNFSELGAMGLTGTVNGDTGPQSINAVLSQRLGYPVKSGEPYWMIGCNSEAQAQAGVCVFPGQVVPQAAWGPVAKATLKFFPAPNLVTKGASFFTTSAQILQVDDQKFGQRVDLVTRAVGNLAFYYHFDDAAILTPFPSNGSNVPGFPSNSPSRSQQFNVSDTKSFGGSAVNELRLNYTRFSINLGAPPASALGPLTSFGFVKGGFGINPDPPSLEGLPYIALGGSVRIGPPLLTTRQADNNYHLADGFSKIVGRHTMKVGTDIRYLQANVRNVPSANGAFNFFGGETGDPFADFLIGAPDSYEQDSTQALDSRSQYYSVYAQDSFKVKSNLTLNYGLRWETGQFFYDTQNKIQTFVPGLQSKIYPGAPLGWVFPGDPGIPRTIAPTRYNWAPRAGIAYSPNATGGILGKLFGGPGQTSIRAGAGIYYTAVEDMPLFYILGDAPFGLVATPNSSYLEAPYLARQGANTPNPFPFQEPTPGTPIDWTRFLPIAGSPVVKHDAKTPYAMQYNFTIQRDVRSTILSIGYVGSQGHHLFAQQPYNPGNPSLCLQIRATRVANGLSPGCGPFGENRTYDLGNGTVVHGVRTYSVTDGKYLSQGLLDFGGANNNYFTTISNSNYNSLQASVQRRVGSLQLLAAYTWAKSLDDTSGFYDLISPYNARLDKALSAFDVKHNFVISYAYDLPFGKGSKGFAKKLLSGWQISGITRFMTGEPIRLLALDDNLLCGCSGLQRPNYSGAPIATYDPRSSTQHQYFDTSAFSRSTTLGLVGNTDRAFFHGPGINNTDLALHKITYIKERFSLELRGEFFNVWNHAQFAGVSGIFGTGAFGDATGARDPRIGQFAAKLHF